MGAGLIVCSYWIEEAAHGARRDRAGENRQACCEAMLRANLLSDWASCQVVVFVSLRLLLLAPNASLPRGFTFPILRPHARNVESHSRKARLPILCFCYWRQSHTSKQSMQNMMPDNILKKPLLPQATME